jgi:single-strand DNA-binding protein
LQYRSWEANDGSKRSRVDVVADNVQFLGGGARNGPDGAAG